MTTEAAVGQQGTGLGWPESPSSPTVVPHDRSTAAPATAPAADVVEPAPPTTVPGDTAPPPGVPEDREPGVREALAAWWPALRYCLAVFAVARAGMCVLGLFAVGVFPSNSAPEVPGRPVTPVTGGWHNAFSAWERFDALWYLRIADQGYRTDDLSAAFFPLYPLLVRGVSTVLGGHLLAAGFVVSNVALVVALTLLYRLTALERSERAARRVVVYVVVFPTGFFLLAPYTESLFLALAVGALYAARTRHWLVAGYCGAFACLTRSTGALVVIALGIEALHQLRESDEPLRDRVRSLAARLTCVAGGATGLLAYLVWWERRHGDWQRPLDAQKFGWGKDGTMPWDTLWAALRGAEESIGSFSYLAIDVLLVLPAFAALVWAVRRIRPAYTVYLLGSLVLPLLLAWDGRPLVSMPRYVLVVFPAFWALAALAERWRAHNAIVGVSAAGLGLCSLLFVNWYFVY